MSEENGGLRAVGDDDRPAQPGRVYNAVYSACYGLSYGVVFSTLFVAAVLPKSDAMRRGFRDGASAANRSVDRVNASVADAYGTVARKLGETVEGVQDRLAERKYLRERGARLEPEHG